MRTHGGARRAPNGNLPPLQALPALEPLADTSVPSAVGNVAFASPPANSDGSPGRRPGALPSLTPRPCPPIGESHPALTPRTNSVGQMQGPGTLPSLPPLAAIAATTSTRTLNGESARGLPTLTPISARSTSSREPVETLCQRAPTSFSGESPAFARRRSSGGTSARLAPLEGLQATPIVEWPLASATAQPHHIPSPTQSSPRICLPSLSSQGSALPDRTELRPACPWMANLDAMVPTHLDESEEEEQSLSRTLDSCTRAGAEKALQDAFLEEQRRGSSPTAAAALALRRCRTSSRESGALGADSLDVNLLPGSQTIDVAEMSPASQAGFQDANTAEELLGDEPEKEDDFFSASRKLLFSEQGKPSLSST